MNDKVFIDLNIILYAYSKTETKKADIANNLIFGSDNIYISKQVTNEVINILCKKFKLRTDDIINVILELDNKFSILDFSLITQINALKIKEKYQFQFYDSLIIATAIENNCSTLFSEDMQHKQIIEDCLQIINLFYNQSNCQF
ncbi:MAG: PIN domain-containing protein [gamma proteobacterium symbiont of Taylorina sp.]|nr:PIN domain-containing protein [gamma proteobacterium symbiont of Taylorina sp.]